ncbi:hypothetical protein [Cytobacillus sp. FSL K6-0265]|uniref:hypothetical protein n=1 Tax=Cytobacillus sp. FSL K6-0265 TaxID=2921448 RepID=UPI0030FC93F1
MSDIHLTAIKKENWYSGYFKTVGFIDSGNYFGRETAYLFPITDYLLQCEICLKGKFIRRKGNG